MRKFIFIVIFEICYVCLDVSLIFSINLNLIVCNVFDNEYYIGIWYICNSCYKLDIILKVNVYVIIFMYLLMYVYVLWNDFLNYIFRLI